jgi:hypothetical protein
MESATEALTQQHDATGRRQLFDISKLSSKAVQLCNRYKHSSVPAAQAIYATK